MKISVIAGSTRPGRFGMQPATWVYELAKQQPGIEVELIDLTHYNLPVLDEPIPASQQKYTKDHTKKWAAAISSSDGFIIVTPEYNHSMSGALKNAIDYLYTEWNYKPVSFVSYGSMAGGSRAVEHLRGIAGELKMYDLREQLLLPNYWERLDERGEYQFTEAQAATAMQLIQQTAFWAEVFKEARTKLAA